ncbi:type I polyketide synthase [Polyangium aurulentum]|uniref:type I polyketide synthase n=1 Tax=Polyangium aurulentum TaxID=2567896 RepID=UPI0010AE6748|nr:type I polyketide synthase [Polyangium aurulentum]UQA61055.1 type I polyketide synthase [Polyangium aurulentum]
MILRPPDVPANAVPDDDAPPPSGLSSMQRAILTIQRMRTRIEAFERAKAEPIAIIGMACRFPGGANSPEAFFRLLEEGLDAVTEVPRERWPMSEASTADPEARAVRWGAFLERVDLFDAQFFGISPREAAKMDPQQRLLLETTWEALEQGGQVPERLVGSRTGVFLGIMNNDYAELSSMAGVEQEDAYTTTGNGHCFPVGRISYAFGFQGPSVAIDTACSSSLVAVHLASQSLRNGECNLAVAGGVNLMLVPSTTRRFAKTQALSPDGRCRAFDASANGFVRGEGCGMVVLKRLSDAERDGDTVLAVIRGSAVNQDGRSTGLTTPNLLAQEAMLSQAIESARVSAADIGYVEAHGTGTSLGDPIEVEALKAVLGSPREDGSPCVLGAVKTNVGHLEAAAGVAGLIKTVLVLQRGMIPRNNHFRTLNPRIRLDGTPFLIPRANLPWPKGAKRRVAGVSSFGMSGTNAHVIVEEYPQNAEEDLAVEASSYLLPISARSPAALHALAAAYGQHLSAPGNEARLHDMVHTASVRRSHHPHRLAVVGGSREEMSAALEAFVRGEAPASVVHGKPLSSPTKVVFVFSGQGSQWFGMGQRLMAEQAIFRSTIETCDALLSARVGWSLLDELTSSESTSRLAETEVAQPAIFAIQVALAELLKSWGIAPDAVIGHSVGEIAAAHVAGILSLEEAIRLVAHRGRIMQRATGLGKMVSVALTEEEARKAIAGREARLSIAAINDPGSVVLSGEDGAIDAVVAALSARGVACRPLRVNYAFHSPQMERLRHELVETLGSVTARQASLAMYSTVTAECVEGEDLRVDYWGKNVRQPVRLAGAIDAALRDGYRFFLEIGPHPVLVGNVQQCLERRDVEGFVAFSLRRQEDERRSLLATAGALYAHGCTVDWAHLYQQGGRCVPLPAYPWQREPYWVDVARGAEPQPPPRAIAPVAPGHALLGASLSSSAHPGVHFWQQLMSPDTLPVLRDHRVRGEVVFSGSGYLEMALSASAEVHGTAAVVIEEVSFERALHFQGAEPRPVQFVLTSTDTGGASFQISSRAASGGGWTRHATGKIGFGDAATGSAGPRAERLDVLRARCGVQLDADEHYRRMEQIGLSYGPGYRGVQALWLGAGEALGRLHVPGDDAGGAAYAVHPALLDSSFQVLAALLHDPALPEGSTYLPAGLQRMRVARRPGKGAFGHARIRSRGGEMAVGDVALLEEDGTVVLSIEGLELRRVDASKALPRDTLKDCVFSVEWRRKERSAAPARGARHEGGWLVISDQGGVGATLASLLRERGERAVRVTFGEHYERFEPDAFTIDPSRLQDYVALLGDAFTDASPCRGVVHLSSLDAASWEATSSRTLEADQRIGCASVLLMAQALLRQGLRDTPRLWVVTRGAVALDDSFPLSVAQATVWGLGRTIVLEHPELELSRVDLDPADDARDAARSLEMELSAEEREDQIALRRDGRRVARLGRDTLPQAPDKPLLRPDAAYLITGGLGGVGLSLAQWMVAEGARHVALVGRRGPSAATLSAIRAMEQAGARVLVLEADVSRAPDVASVLARIDQNFPPLSGVVHAAAVLADRTLLELSGDDLARVLAPKMLGAFHLHAATLGRKLDFFLLYSSAASLLGSSGQGNYAAANAFLDALAHARRAAGLPGTSVQWGPFAEVGLAAASDNRGARLAHRGLESLAPLEAHAALPRLVSQPKAEVSLVRFDVRQWLEFHPQAAGSPFWSELRKEQVNERRAAADGAGFRRALEEKPPFERLAAVEEHVRVQLGKVLQLDPARIDLRAPFTGLGVDSLMSLELRNRLEGSLGLKLPNTLLFTYANASALAENLLVRLAPPPAPVQEPAAPPTDRVPEAPPPALSADDDLIAAFDASISSIKDDGLL